MTNRRKFLKLSALGGGAILLGRCAPAEGKADAASATTIESGEKPIVLSTWNHGLAANDGAWKILSAGGHALDAVEQGVSVTESDFTNRSVGLGGRPDRDGKVTLDACIMDHRHRAGGVAFLQNIEHPIQVARKVMETTPHVLIVGEGAYRFALENGFKPVDFEVPIPEVKKDWEKWLETSQYKPIINIENHDTIGMIAMDVNGDLSGACTTSGLAYKVHGRVGDSPIIGAGLYVDNEIGAATATGVGEAVIRIAGSHTVVEMMRQGATPDEACKEAVERIIRKHENVDGLQVGFLAIDKHGRYGGYSIYKGFDFALRTTSKNEMVESKYLRPWE